MPRRPVLIALAVAVPVLYFLARPGPSEPKREGTPALDRYEQSAADRDRASKAWLRAQIAEHERSRAKVDARLAELEARLRELQAPAQAAASEPESPKPARDDVSEADVATWMDAQLQGGVDAAATAEAHAQLQGSLAAARLSELRVENVACGERYCRASFYQDGGERPALRELFGAPPLTGEGFTLDEPEGRVAIYFGRNGATVNDLRGAAFAAAAP